jgi:hypothetical protein
MSITIDTYRYEEIYPSFKAATDEKEKTARINAAFLNRLADEGIVLKGNDAIAIADIGSGPCDTLVKYLTGVKFDPGFKVRATDYSIEYTDERNARRSRLSRRRNRRARSSWSISRRAPAIRLRDICSTCWDRMTPPRSRMSFESSSRPMFSITAKLRGVPSG